VDQRPDPRDHQDHRHRQRVDQELGRDAKASHRDPVEEPHEPDAVLARQRDEIDEHGHRQDEGGPHDDRPENPRPSPEAAAEEQVDHGSREGQRRHQPDEVDHGLTT
jgi:hypothetical protein